MVEEEEEEEEGTNHRDCLVRERISSLFHVFAGRFTGITGGREGVKTSIAGTRNWNVS